MLEGEARELLPSRLRRATSLNEGGYAQEEIAVGFAGG